MVNIKLVYFSTNHHTYEEAVECEAVHSTALFETGHELIKLLGIIIRTSNILIGCLGTQGDSECGLLVDGVYISIDNAITFIKGTLCTH